MRFSQGHRLLFIALACAGLGACPAKRKIASPEPPVPRHGNVEALRAFEESQAQFKQGQTDVDPARFESIAAEFPDDPIVPHALLYAGMSGVRAGEYAKAIENLGQLIDNPEADQALVLRGRLYRGLAKNYAGDQRGAVADLQAGETSVGNSAGEREEWLAAMAVSQAGAGQFAAALPFFDAWYAAGRESERAYIRNRLEESIGKLADGDLGPAYAAITDKGGPSAALTGRRLAGVLRGGGDSAGAERVDRETAGARKALGLDVVIGGDSGLGEPSRVGAILPLTGRQSRIGDYSGRGLALAASFGGNGGSGASSGAPLPFDLLMRDSASSADKAADDFKELAAADVVAVVGPVRRDSSLAVAELAGKTSIPVVTLSGVPDATDSPFVFHAVHSPEMRAQALARHAYSLGVKDFAILRPKVKYGEAVGAAFREEVERLGGDIIVEVAYPEDTTSFKPYTSKLKKPWSAIFIPDSSKRLELIAPALAVANFTSRPKGEKGSGRSIIILSTAEALSPSFVDAAGRYAWGAVLAPGFYADERDGTIGPFVDRYRRAFSVDPSATDAYAFDAALAIRAVVEAGASNRGEVAAGLATVKVAGLTGTIEFDPGTHRRADPGLLFEVQEIAAGGYSIRALR